MDSSPCLARRRVRFSPTFLVILLLVGPGSALADDITNWNVIGFHVFNASPALASGTAQSRALAIMHIAIHDALNAIDPQYETYSPRVTAPAGASKAAAIVGAADGALRRIFATKPSAIAILNTKQAQALAAIPDGQAKVDGLALGDQIAAALVAARANDNIVTPPPGYPGYQFLTGPGFYQPVAPTFARVVAVPWLKFSTPFAMNSTSQFRLEPPPALTSAEYTTDYNEVKLKGRDFGSTRTQAETDVGLFFQENSVPTTQRIARNVAIAQGTDLMESARLFALLNLVATDAAIASFETKVFYNYWRPETAIREAATDGNPDTEPIAGWLPLRPTQNHPEYPSNHCVVTGSQMRILKEFFGTDRVSFSTTSATSIPANAVVRSYTRFSQVTDDVIDARVFIGFHFRNSDNEGAEMGKNVAHWIAKRFLRPLNEHKKEKGEHGQQESEPSESGDVEDDD